MLYSLFYVARFSTHFIEQSIILSQYFQYPNKFVSLPTFYNSYSDLYIYYM